LFLCGDVITGRGVDQVLPYPVRPVLYESYVQDAREYVQLAEAANGPIARPVSFDYIWGDALEELQRFGTDARIVNLETSITSNEEPWPAKGIDYRMHPKNVRSITNIPSWTPLVVALFCLWSHEPRLESRVLSEPMISAVGLRESPAAGRR
jgi:poly-gamma-glutamate capsule biosynthesis protein CapA/YwtB (metallophosphatase superfamily)